MHKTFVKKLKHLENHYSTWTTQTINFSETTDEQTQIITFIINNFSSKEVINATIKHLTF